jgi:hypothetical protein
VLYLLTAVLHGVRSEHGWGSLLVFAEIRLGVMPYSTACTYGKASGSRLMATDGGSAIAHSLGLQGLCAAAQHVSSQCDAATDKHAIVALTF